jgi:hypothetical protein
MLRVYQTAMKDRSPTRVVRKYAAGTMEAIANDPDGAAWQVGQGDLEAVALVYNRDQVEATIRFEPGRAVLSDPAQVRAARERVLRLVRLPRYR